MVALRKFGVPKSPPFLAELQSDSVCAIVMNMFRSSSGEEHAFSWFRNAVICEIASSLDWLITSWRQLDGLRDPECFLRMCKA